MSAQNIAIVQSLYADFAKGDTAALFRNVSPDIRIRQSAELPWGGEYHGHDGLRQFFANLTRHLNNTALPIDRYLDSDNHVIAIGRTQGTVRANNKPFDVPLAHIWTLEDGLATAFTPYIDHPTMHAALA